MAELIKEFRCIPRYAAEANIKALPDAQAVPGMFVGEGWKITLETLPPVQLGSLEMGRLRFVLSGSEETVERVWNDLAPGFLRGGA